MVGSRRAIPSLEHERTSEKRKLQNEVWFDGNFGVTIRIMDEDITALQAAIKNLHGCDSTWIESVPVKETFQGQIVWEGEVQVFDLQGHPRATRAYAWSYRTDEGKRRTVAVLHEGPVDSPENAVKAAIVFDRE